MANTTNLNLSKLAGTEKLKSFPSPYNDNMDAIDGAFGAGFGVSGKPSVNAEINSLGDGLAILANGNTHAAITSGQFVYVRGHGTLADGLYQATANIAEDGTLSGSNLTADPSGGLNTVYDTLNGKLTVVKNTSITGITLWKQGNVVTINVALNHITTTAIWEVIATLPVGFRPSMELAGWYETNSGFRFIITPQGQLECSGIISDKAIRFTGVYIVE